MRISHISIHTKVCCYTVSQRARFIEGEEISFDNLNVEFARTLVIETKMLHGTELVSSSTTRSEIAESYRKLEFSW